MASMAPNLTTISKTDDNLLFRRISWRLLPVLCLCYVFNYLDRTNVGYAQLQMKEQLAFSDAVFGLGASIFFVGYALFEVPSNMLLARIGVRATLLRIMGLWGLASAAMMFVSTPTEFYVLRFLVGVFEAGFAPGVLYYLTLWFPRRRLAQATALFFMAFSLAPIVAGPTAGAIMTWLDGAHGLRGWQWLFILEGVPCVLLGLVAFATLPDRPEQARWLSDTERARIRDLLQADAPASAGHTGGGVRTAMRDARVWVLGFVSFLVILGIYALAFWKPTLLKGMGLSIMQVGLVATIPAACGVAASVLVGRHSDRTGERRWHFAIPAVVAALGLVLTTLFPKDPLPAILCLTLVSIGTSSAFTVLWSMPGGILTGQSAAAGIAIISTVGGSAGMVAPAAVGAIKASTGSFTLSLYLLSLALVLAAVILVTWFRPQGAASLAAHSAEAH
ncbi:putative metabolite transport protein NicT [Cupriavidus taiwanensis]|uniref:MFS transporter n=1 Tax=Cupriavidus taiwanensis TaxID=164546 RepID=UPI000E18D5E3|nr:MFS transporter [Cupriavidus taiwanensis]SOY97472.1 putative metabolite transport protein NicT [Cupriavidus taiwanensis]SOZ00202.1 putative metabolite transport protein NicT [Cupriavidus taiwanensis]